MIAQQKFSYRVINPKFFMAKFFFQALLVGLAIGLIFSPPYGWGILVILILLLILNLN
jgi:hypothetical protein